MVFRVGDGGCTVVVPGAVGFGVSQVVLFRVGDGGCTVVVSGAVGFGVSQVVVFGVGNGGVKLGTTIEVVVEGEATGAELQVWKVVVV